MQRTLERLTGVYKASNTSTVNNSDRSGDDDHDEISKVKKI